VAYVRAKFIPNPNGEAWGPYYYLVENVRKGDKVVTKHRKYLGKFNSAGEAQAAAAEAIALHRMERLAPDSVQWEKRPRKAAAPKKRAPKKRRKSEDVVPKEDASERVVPKTTQQALERLNKLNDEYGAARRDERAAFEAVYEHGEWNALIGELEGLKGKRPKAQVARRKELEALFDPHSAALGRSKRAEERALKVYDSLSDKGKRIVEEERIPVLVEGLSNRGVRENLSTFSDFFS
jgi:hypothetical protein